MKTVPRFTVIGVVVSLTLAAAAWGQQEASHARVVRLSFVEGTVTVQGPGVSEWSVEPLRMYRLGRQPKLSESRGMELGQQRRSISDRCQSQWRRRSRPCTTYMGRCTGRNLAVDGQPVVRVL